MPFPASLRSLCPRFGACLLAGAAMLLLPARKCRAQDNGTPSLSDAVAQKFADLKPMVDVKQWDAALAILASVESTVDPDSYDMAEIQLTKGKILVQKNDMADAIAPFEAVMNLARRHPNYFYRQDYNDVLHYLSQIYSEESTEIKLVPGPDLQRQEQLQRTYLEKAVYFTRRWLQSSPGITQDDELSYADMLYNLATSAANGKADEKLLDEAEQEAKKGLKLAIHPREQLYELVAAISENRDDYVQTADYLEFLVQEKPDSRVYWPQLMAVYSNLASEAKDQIQSRQYYARAINAVERAQARGQMKGSKNNLLLVTFYSTVGQYGKATELLSNGLRSGGIESTEKNWEALADFYRQLDQDFRAIAAYQDAKKIFPGNGQFDYAIAQTYMELNNTAKANEYFALAVSEDHLSSPYTTEMFLAYTSFELGKYDEAKKACDEAAKYPEAAKDPQFKNLLQSIAEIAPKPDTPAPADDHKS